MQNESEELLLLYRNMTEDQKQAFLEIARKLLREQSYTTQYPSD